jgi:hypothetical protein
MVVGLVLFVLGTLYWAIFLRQQTWLRPAEQETPMLVSRRESQSSWIESGPGLNVSLVEFNPIPDELGVFNVRHPVVENPPRNITAVIRNDDPLDPLAATLSTGETIRFSYVKTTWEHAPDEKRIAYVSAGEDEPMTSQQLLKHNVSEPAVKIDKRRISFGMAGQLDYRFAFRAPDSAGRHRLFLRAIDQKTGHTVHGQYSNGYKGAEPGWIQQGFRSYHWHDGPLTIEFDIAIGEPETVEIDIEDVGETVQLAHGSRVRYFGAVPGRWSGLNGKHEGGISTRRCTVNTKEAKRWTAVFLAFEHPENAFAVEVAALDPDGEVLTFEIIDSMRLDYFSHAQLKMRKDRIDRLRFRSYPIVDRVRFTVPRVPGLPKSNRGLTNLCEIRIPYLRVKKADELYKFISRTAHLNTVDVGMKIKFPDDYFPKEFHDVSINEILVELEQYFPGKYGFKIVNGVALGEAEAPWWTRRWERVRDWFSD